MTATALNTKTGEVENKTHNISTLMRITVRNTNINEVKNKIPDHAKYISPQKVKSRKFWSKIKIG